jgi:hypothetical protein
MHEAVGNQDFVKGSLNTLIQHLGESRPDALAAIGVSIGATDRASIDEARLKLLEQLRAAKTAADSEEASTYSHYVSRFDLVGLYQSVLSRIFSDIPALQGYGDRNPIWVITPIEQALYASKAFFGHVYESVHSEKKPLIASFIQAWKQLRFERADYPKGVPAPISFPEECKVALLADWGGDNPAARRVAQRVAEANPAIAIHLGDIYYGGVKEECDAFLHNWPSRRDGGVLRQNANFALNGNHEMYSGGESYFKVVLKAFDQPQPFFCIENQYWRLIGLDSAYNGGRLKPSGPDDQLDAQWNWLIGLLKAGSPKQGTILLTHHQPVSAHQSEYEASLPLRQDVAELLAMDGIGQGAIFGWFFGHEHRCAIYDDEAAPYLARLIGSGCIPHAAQRELKSDPGCTPARWFNKRETNTGSGSAVSMYAELQFIRENVVIVYTDEDGMAWGSETWNSDPNRVQLQASGFAPADGIGLN